MASVLPSRDEELVQFFVVRQEIWEDAPPATLGLSLAQITALKAQVGAAVDAMDQNAKAQVAARTATATKNDEVRQLRSMGGQLVNTIKAFAEGQANPAAVYNAASIPLPGTTPVPTLKTATNVIADPNADGSVTVKWKAEDQAPGAAYTVWRKLGTGQFAQIATVGERKFVDFTVPAGTFTANYYLRTVKGTQTLPPSETATVQFGAGGASGVTGSQAA